jgi:DNA-binding Lrp family transcriptional regulator
LKDVELKLVAELTKNSRRSDRELAKHLRISQPTVSRIRSRLEKEGVIREFTIIPDFAKLGYNIASITLAKLKAPPSRETIDEVMRHAAEMEKKNPSPTIVSMRGIGCNADYASVAFHKTYSEYAQYMQFIRQFPELNVDEIQSFVIDLQDKGHFRYLTFSVFANYLLRMKESQ